MASRNPFTPTFGTMPFYFAGRTRVIQDMAEAFESGPGNPNLSTIIVGARGTGKTALLARIAQEASSRAWIAANVSCVPGMLDDIIQRTCEAAEHLIEKEPKLRVSGIGIAQLLEVEITQNMAAADQPNWRTRMNRILQQLGESGVGLLITVDEVDAGLDEMVQLASVYQHFVREGRKVALVMAGLPFQVSSLLSNKSVSFLRRSRQHRLERVDDADVRDAFLATVVENGRVIEERALDKAVAAIEGFPYMMQLVGYRTWASAKGDLIGVSDVDSGIRLANEEMREGVLNTTLAELSAGDIRFLRAMLPDGGASTLADVASRMSVASNYASQYKRRLLEAGVIGVRLGEVLYFELPGIAEALQE